MKKLIPLVLILCAAAGARAQIAGTPDYLGVYFDPGATIDEMTGPIAYVYVVLTNGTMPSVKSFDCKIWVEGTLAEVGWTHFEAPTSAPDAIIAYNPDSQDYAVSYSEPIPYTGTTLTLMQKLIVDPENESSLLFHTQPPTDNPDNPGYCTVYAEAGGEAYLCGPNGEWTCAGYNFFECNPFAVEGITFGSVKALYR